MKMLRAGVVALAASLTLPAMSQTMPTASDMQILEQKIQADKKVVVAVNMQLTDTEAKGFWPIYDAYQKDLETIHGRLAKVIATYADAYNRGPVPDDLAQQLISDYLDTEQDETQLKRSYIPKLSTVLPGAKVAGYIQLETKMQAIVHYQLAANIPLVQTTWSTWQSAW
jgi:hypothetical protein